MGSEKKNLIVACVMTGLFTIAMIAVVTRTITGEDILCSFHFPDLTADESSFCALSHSDRDKVRDLMSKPNPKGTPMLPNFTFREALDAVEKSPE
jgi:hypothetical protein